MKEQQQHRGKWIKSRKDRGTLKRGNIFYIRFRDQMGKMRVERVGPSLALARKAYRKRKAEVDERRFFPVTGVLFDEIIDDVIARTRASFELKYPGRQFKTHNNYEIVRRWFTGRIPKQLRRIRSGLEIL